MDSAQLFLLATICFVAMLSPGPDFILVTRNALTYERKQAMATAAGIVAGCLVHATYCILGLVLIISKSILLFSAIKIAGGLYLAYLGIRALLSKSEGAFSFHEGVRKSVSTKRAFLEGFFCNVLNPKCALFLLSLFTQFIPVGSSFSDKSIVAGVFVLESAIYWPVLVMLLKTNFIERVFNSVHAAIDKVCGALLLYIGVRVAVSRE